MHGGSCGWKVNWAPARPSAFPCRPTTRRCWHRPSSVRRALVADDEIGYRLRTRPSAAQVPAVGQRFVLIDPEGPLRRLIQRYLPNVEVDAFVESCRGIGGLAAFARPSACHQRRPGARGATSSASFPMAHLPLRAGCRANKTPSAAWALSPTWSSPSCKSSCWRQSAGLVRRSKPCCWSTTRRTNCISSSACSSRGESLLHLASHHRAARTQHAAGSAAPISCCLT